MPAFGVAKFVGCHEEAVRREYLRGVLVSQTIGNVIGPEPEPDDIDGRPPAVVVWHDADMFFLVASSEMSCDALIEIAVSLYPPRSGKA